MFGAYLIILGIILIFTIPILAVMDGVESQQDLIQWYMNKPLEFLAMVKPMIFSGIGLVVAGLAVIYMP